MKVTSLSAQLRSPDRVNIFIDGKFRFSLDISQVVDLKVKVGREYSVEELVELEQESLFGKVYMRALEYILMRPHSAKEVRDYLRRKTYATKYRSRKTGEILEREGVSQSVVERAFDRLLEKKLIDDNKFAIWWIENRNARKGTSLAKLRSELMGKGVNRTVIDQALVTVGRDELADLKKVIEKKRYKYEDVRKLKQYLVGQGFSYSDVNDALAEAEEED
ncbi:MAG: RecX family transcriptional regulator [Candidatus Saccharimonas sp.]